MIWPPSDDDGPHDNVCLHSPLSRSIPKVGSFKVMSVMKVADIQVACTNPLFP